MNLRPYQEQAINDIRKFFAKGGKHCILHAPTGAGKTVIFSAITKMTNKKGGKVLILTDRAELLMQANGTLKNFNISASLIRAGIKYYNNNFMTFIAMSQTLRNRYKQHYWQEFIKSFALVIIDECHKQEFNYLLESKLLENKPVIGFTATPQRSGNMRQLGLDYEKIIPTVSVQWLIDYEYLVDADIYAVDGVNSSNIEFDRAKGDFQTKSMFNSYNSPKLYSGVVTNWQKLASNTKTLIFCVNIEHTILTALEFEKNGIKCKYVVSGVGKPKLQENPTQVQEQRYLEKKRVYDLYISTFERLSGKREDVFASHQNNEFKILVNASIATTGYDDKSLETIVLLRATTRQTLFLQMIGRGSRIFNDKEKFNILDFGENVKRLGTYSEDRLWSLWHEKRQGQGLPPIKSCGYDSNGKQINGQGMIFNGCNRPILASYMMCPFCGFQYPKKKAKEVELTLVKMASGKTIRNMTYNELYNYWKGRKYNTRWLYRQLYYKGGADEIRKAGKIYGWTHGQIWKAVQIAKNL